MYNLRPFMRNKLVLIELALWWHAVIPIHTTGELEPNSPDYIGCYESTTFLASVCLFYRE